MKPEEDRVDSPVLRKPLIPFTKDNYENLLGYVPRTPESINQTHRRKSNEMPGMR